jgi:hypothetical protein
MKKYIVPELQVIGMETTSVIATSANEIGISSESVDDTFNFSTDRKRGADWEAYEE